MAEKPNFAIDLTEISSTTETQHSLSESELQALREKFELLKKKVEQEGHEMTLEDQRTVIQFLRADRETKFILNSKPPKAVREVKERVTREPKAPKVKKPKKLGQKAMGLLYLKQMKGEELTEEEQTNMNFTLQEAENVN